MRKVLIAIAIVGTTVLASGCAKCHKCAPAPVASAPCEDCGACSDCNYIELPGVK